MAFIISNSKKTPPKVLVANEERIISEAILGGYTWKVFGSNIIADSIDLKTLEYTSENTVISRPGKLLTLSAEEKFSVKDAKYINILSSEEETATYKSDEASAYYFVNAPEIEGSYLFLINLEYYGKGEAEYAIKVVVTDENIYDVKEMVKHKNTDIFDIVKIKEILNDLPYSNKLAGITINTVDTPKSINVKYDNISVDKKDLLNNTIALFSLIPNLGFISYDTKVDAESIYYTRTEINNMMNRNVLEYVEDTELWLKEVIYKEKNVKENNYITIYTSAISSSLSNFSGNEIGEYIAIDLGENIASGDIDEFDKKEILKNLNNEYENILLVNGNDFNNQKGTTLFVDLLESDDNIISSINIKIQNSQNKKYDYSYKITQSGDSVFLESNIDKE